MEYLLGSFTTFALLIFFSMLFKNSINKNNINKNNVKYSQSHIFMHIKPLLPDMSNIKKIKNTQSLDYERKINVKIIILDNYAYWIKENQFYKAEMVNNLIDPDTTTTVDTIGMDSIQLDKMLFIMDKLREGLDDDSGSTRNQ
jgi:hypothetical protein